MWVEVQVRIHNPKARVDVVELEVDLTELDSRNTAKRLLQDKLCGIGQQKGFGKDGTLDIGATCP